jgi:hypothetical protein
MIQVHELRYAYRLRAPHPSPAFRHTSVTSGSWKTRSEIFNIISGVSSVICEVMACGGHRQMGEVGWPFTYLAATGSSSADLQSGLYRFGPGSRAPDYKSDCGRE